MAGRFVDGYACCARRALSRVRVTDLVKSLSLLSDAGNTQ
jgi:hypothetical protein